MSDTKQLLGIGSRVKHPAFGEGVITKINVAAYEVCFIQHGLKPVGREYDKWEIIEAIQASNEVTWSEMEKSLMKILKHWSDISEVIPMGDRWDGGTMVLQPKDPSLKPKEIPIESFFHKIVMVRDRLRVMEQRVNAHKVLDEEDKINLQQYITRIYGSLTTFNVLFKYKEHQFTGEKS
ncbi:MAG: hypothetical protein KDC24_01400 [Saprospiraceae bacterium]|nr:hypothetical protein [Saprospiraceae bacterium]